MEWVVEKLLRIWIWFILSRNKIDEYAANRIRAHKRKASTTRHPHETHKYLNQTTETEIIPQLSAKEIPSGKILFPPPFETLVSRDFF